MHALDDKWFNLLMATHKTDPDIELPGAMRISNEERNRFLENDIENPRFVYQQAKISPKTVEAFTQLKATIELEEKNEVVKSLYSQKIKAQLLRLKMLEATSEGDDQAFFEAGCKVYGLPQKPLFSLIAKRVMELCEVHTPGPQEAAAKQLKKIFSKIDTTHVPITQDILPEPIPDDGTYMTAQDVAHIFTEVLERHHISDWNICIDQTDTRKRFSVMISNKTVCIPNDSNLSGRRQPLTKLHAQALAEHEIGVHVRRAYEGLRQPLKLLSVGLHGYLRGEEGLAGYVQQQVEGATEYYGFDRYLAICLALGMDGETRDFRGVYSVMYHYYTLISSAGVTKARIENAAWEVCVRIFRGTTGEAQGMAYTRDLVYFEGNVGIWKLLIDRPELFELLFIGKFDPLSQAHIKALQSLHILPEW